MDQSLLKKRLLLIFHEESIQWKSYIEREFVKKKLVKNGNIISCAQNRDLLYWDLSEWPPDCWALSVFNNIIILIVSPTVLDSLDVLETTKCHIYPSNFIGVALLCGVKNDDFTTSKQTALYQHVKCSNPWKLCTIDDMDTFWKTISDILECGQENKAENNVVISTKNKPIRPPMPDKSKGMTFFINKLRKPPPTLPRNANVKPEALSRVPVSLDQTCDKVSSEVTSQIQKIGVKDICKALETTQLTDLPTIPVRPAIAKKPPPRVANTSESDNVNPAPGAVVLNQSSTEQTNTLDLPIPEVPSRSPVLPAAPKTDANLLRPVKAAINSPTLTSNLNRKLFTKCTQFGKKQIPIPKKNNPPVPPKRIPNVAEPGAKLSDTTSATSDKKYSNNIMIIEAFPNRINSQVSNPTTLLLLTHNICIKMEQKELTKAFMMISNWKKTLIFWFI